MSLARTLAITALASSAGLIVTACSGGLVEVGSSEQQLVKTPGGGATGNGATCSFDDAVSHDVTTGETKTSSSGGGEYSVGDTFKSPDGCNDCACAKDGIYCTMRACAPVDPGDPGQPCTDEAKVCPDGSTVGRTGPSCEFAPCPEQGNDCPAIARICNDGSTAKPGPGCTHICPEDGSNVACTDDAMLCPDGKTYVGRTGPSCEFSPCP